MSLPEDARTRFSDRAGDYARFRPDYPAAVVRAVAEAAGAGPLVEFGAGTGLFTRAVAARGVPVIAVEPNAPMRAAGAAAAGRLERWIDGSAEATDLEDGIATTLAAAQAFHWFDPERANTEWRRLLRPGGSVHLVWNDRDHGSDPFMRAYEALLETHGTDYHERDHQRYERAAIDAFLGPGATLETTPHAHALDRAGLHGRVHSASYAPAAGTPERVALGAALDALFDAHARDGRVTFRYVTRHHRVNW